jgi:hypothetical protein
MLVGLPLRNCVIGAGPRTGRGERLVPVPVRTCASRLLVSLLRLHQHQLAVVGRGVAQRTPGDLCVSLLPEKRINHVAPMPVNRTASAVIQ